MYQRAAQFAPFAALTGHDAAIRETARLTDSQIEPTPNRVQSSWLELPRCEGGRPTGQPTPNRVQSSWLELPRCEGRRPTGQLGDENNEILNRRFAIIRDHLKDTPEISVTFFQPDAKKVGGSYESYKGCIKNIDDYEQQLVMIDGKKITLSSILDIDGKLFNNE